jgi:hypothetical protein
VRDAGSLPGIALETEPDDGGRVIPCGPFLAPRDFFLAHLYEGTPPGEAVDAARARVRDGAEWVKVVADYPGGEHFNPLDPRLGYPVELVADIAARSTPRAAGSRST